MVASRVDERERFSGEVLEVLLEVDGSLLDPSVWLALVVMLRLMVLLLLFPLTLLVKITLLGVLAVKVWSSLLRADGGVFRT